MPLADLPQSNKQHAVPQNIMDVEFKLVGDLTMRQFAYLLLFGGLAYLTTVFVIGIFKWPFAVFFTLLALGLAFVPIGERGLDEVIVNFFKSIYSPTQRIWTKEAFIPPAFLHDNLAVVRQELITLAPTSSRRRLEEYLEYKQTSDDLLDPLDIPINDYIKKVHDAFKDTPILPGSGVGVMLEEPVTLPPQFQPQPEAFVPEQPQEQPEGTKEETSLTTQTAPPMKPTVEISTPLQPKPAIVRHEKHRRSSATSLNPITPDMHSGRRFINLVPTSGELVLPIRGERVIQTSEQGNVDQEIKEKTEKLQLLLAQIKSSPELEQHTAIQDSQATRSNPWLAQINKPELLAPPKIESPKIQPSPPAVQEPQITPQPVVQVPVAPLPDKPFKDEKPDWLPKQQMPNLTEETHTYVPEKEKTTQIDDKAKKLVDQLKGENEKLNKQISELQSFGQDSTNLTQDQIRIREEMIRKLEMDRQRTQSDYESLQKQLLDLQNKLTETEKSSASTGPAGPTKPVYAKIQPLTDKPNVISGIAHLQDGTVLEGVLMIVKNNKGEAVRAFKSNSLGQFMLTTPLINGVYTLEVNTDNRNLSFDIISVEAKGVVIAPIEVIGK